MYHKKDQDEEDSHATERPRDIDDVELTKMSNRLTAEYFGLLPIDLSYNNDGSISLLTDSTNSTPLYYPFKNLPSQEEVENHLLEKKKSMLLSLYECN